MRAPRTPVIMGLVLLLCAKGLCEESAKAEQDTTSHKSLFGRIMDMVKHAEESATGADAQSTTEKERALERKDSHKHRTKNGEQILEIFPRDLRKKKVLELLTGPLYFSPKCRKHVYRLYHNTRDCTIPAYYKRCARLLTRLAGSPRCLES